MHLKLNKSRHVPMASIAKSIVKLLILTVMAITNSQANAQSQSANQTPTPSQEVKEPGQNEVFDHLAHTVASLITRNEGVQRAIETTAHNDRVVDVTAFTALAKSARVHLTENGSMLFSYTMDNKVYNHQMTDEERQKLDSALTNGDLSTKEQMKQIASVFSGISINTNVANKFDNDMSVSQNVRNSMQR